MSYFVFGLIDPRINCVMGGGEDIEPVRASALREGFDPKFGSEIGQDVVREMMNSDAEATSLPFLLTRLPFEDTSDSLVSPFVLSARDIRANVDRMGRWLKSILAVSKVERVRLWMTEGFDVSFEPIDVTADEFSEEVGRRILEEGDVPSLCVFVHRR